MMEKRPGGLEKRCPSPTTAAKNDDPPKLQRPNTSHVSTTGDVDNGIFNNCSCFRIGNQQRHLLPFHFCPLQTPAMVNTNPLNIQQNTAAAAAQLSRRFCNDVNSKKPLDDEHGDQSEIADLLNNVNNNVHIRATTSNFSFKKHKVSTSRTLYNHEASSSSSSSSFANKQRITSAVEEEEAAQKEDSTTNLYRFRRYSEEDIKEEKRLGVTTKLSLGFENPWKINKKLTDSDVGDMSRLMLHSNQVEEHILPHLVADDDIRDGNEVKVTVWDSDTHSEHQLIFTQWRSSKGYVLKRNWIKDFVKRRNLKVGDEVGLFVDASGRSNSMLMYFMVLKRASVLPPP